MTTWI